MDIEHLSISRLNTYENCEQNYKYKYHLRAKADVPEPIFFVYGKLIHKSIELHTKSKGEENIFDISKKLMSGIIPLEEENPKEIKIPYEYTVKLSKHLKNYLSIASKIGFNGEIEKKFLIDLDYPNKKMLKGVIDRIVIKDDQIMILDWKTTKDSNYLKDYTNITSDIQLQCYARVIMKELNVNPKNISAALVYLDVPKIVPARFSEKTLENCEKRLLDAYNTIASKLPENVVGKPSVLCKYCQYRISCAYSSYKKLL